MLNNNNIPNNSVINNSDFRQKLEDRKVFDQFLNKTQHVTCDKARGHLVKENALQQFGAVFTDGAKDVINLGEAIAKGNSNDLELGRMNDLGLKLGGGLIAAALMGSKATTNKKLMEAVGFGTFFSVMSLWPKLAIGLPTKLMHGFDPQQKYIDSQGRKKLFFQDNQYLPWDVWTKEDLNKVADKMKVPTNLKDREEYTKEKMRTIALQDNTLWMMTAGLATPLLTSLACNGIESGLSVPVANLNLTNLSGQAGKEDLAAKVLKDKTLFKQQDEAFANIINSLKEGKKPENLAEQLSEIFDITRFAENEQISKGVKRTNLSDAQDLVQRLFPETDGFLNNGFIEKLVDGSEEEAAKAREVFEWAYKKAEQSSQLKGKVDFESVVDNAKGIVANNPELRKAPWARKLKGGIAGFDEELKAIAKQKGGCSKETVMEAAQALEELYANSVKPAQAEFRVFGKQIKALNNISGEKYNRVSRKAIKALGFTDKEIKLIKNANEGSSDVIQKIITDKLQLIANDEKKYSDFVETLKKESGKIETSTFGDKATIEGTFEKLSQRINDKLASLGANFQEKGMETVQDSSFANTIKKGLGGAEKEAAKTNITSVNAMINKIQSALDLEKQISDGSLLKEWIKHAEANELKGASAMSADEINDLYNVIRKASWQSSYGDAMNKYYAQGNGAFFKTLTDTIFAKAGKDANMDNWKDALRSISNETFYVPNETLKTTVRDASEAYVEEAVKSHKLKFADFGESLLGTFKKQIGQVYNDKTWMKTFGGITAALVGVTLISQLFFGKVKNAHLYQTKTQQDTFVNGNDNGNQQ